MTIGFLEFGSGHPSVVLEHDLTAKPNWVADGIALTDLSTAVAGDFNETGFSPNGRYLRFQGMLPTLIGSKDEGQISIDVEKEWCCVNDPASGSFGVTLPARQAIFEFQTVSNKNITIRRNLGADAAIDASWNGVGIDKNPINGLFQPATLTTRGKGDYVKLSIGWKTIGSNVHMMLAVDGIVYGIESYVKSTINEDLGDDVWIGGRSGTDIVGDFRLRNLIVSNEAPEFSSDRKILLFGDSQVRDSNQRVAPYYDNGQVWELLKALHRNHGVHHDSSQVWIERRPGYRVSEENIGNSLSEEITDVLSTINPTDVILIAATNDAIGTIPADFFSSYENLVATIKNFSSVERFAATNVRSFIGNSSLDTPSNRSNRDTVNSYISGEVNRLINAYILNGAEVPPDSFTWLGQISGEYNDLHLGVSAAEREGIAYAAAIMTEIGLPKPSPPVYSAQAGLLGDAVSLDLGAGWTLQDRLDAVGLPGGLSMDAAGEVTGTLNQVGQFAARIMGENEYGRVSAGIDWIVTRSKVAPYRDYSNEKLSPIIDASTEVEFYVRDHGFPVVVSQSGLTGAEEVAIEVRIGDSWVPFVKGGGAVIISVASPQVEIDDVGRYRCNKPVTSSPAGIYINV